jgi:hypothetical protein
MQHHTRSPRRRLTALAVAGAATSAVALSLVTPASAGAAPADATAAAPAVTKIEGTAANAAGLVPTVNAYRSLLGDPDNGSTPGSQPSGRREINWDGVPDNRAAPALLPPDFFNTVAPRGAVFSTARGNKVQVSADSDNPTNTPVRFGDINPQYANIFATFSPERLFTPLDTNKMTVRFFQPGSTKPATVKGFGAVFTDVDLPDSTKIEFYDRWGGQIYWRYVPKGGTAGKSLSFLGIKTTADIYEVRITTGNAPLSAWNSDGNGLDLVVMDDFLYAEPRPLQ